MTRSACLALAAAGIWLATGCGRRAARPEASSARPVAEPGQSLGLRFHPPADGLLTDEQVDRFIRVRRAAKGRTDAEAAGALGVSPDELAWVRARITEALVALDDRRVREASLEVYAKTLASMRGARGSVRDPVRARVLEEQIAGLERERAALRREQVPPPAILRNMRRVAGRRAELEAVAP